MPRPVAERYDVVAVHIKENTVRILAENKTEANADAIVNMAIARRGLDEEFYAPVLTGSYKEGDKWRGRSATPEGLNTP